MRYNKKFIKVKVSIFILNALNGLTLYQMSSNTTNTTLEMRSIEEDVGQPLKGDKLDEIIHRVSRMVILNGMQRKVSETGLPEMVEQLQFTLFPSVMPRQVLLTAKTLQPQFQTLLYRVANDHDFMHACLKNVIAVDEFTRKLWDIYENVRSEGVAQSISIVIVRNDFMMEQSQDTRDHLQLKQVEINTIAAARGGVSSAMKEIHRYSMSLADIQYKEDQLPYNKPIKGIAKGLVIAWSMYQKESAYILFLVGKFEPHTPDQMWVEREVFKQNRHIKIMFRTFDQINKQYILGEDKELIVDGKEIAVVYYRHGYIPDHYPTPMEYNMRLQIERSNAIKCPTVAFQLAGCKKIQQCLSVPGMLEQFITDIDVVRALRSTHVRQYDIDMGAEADITVTKALKNPDRYYLKPQREGGGNNKYGESLRAYLTTVKTSPERSSWVLMERIAAFPHRNRLIRTGVDLSLRNVVTELGIYGVHISTPSEQLCNVECGYLMRTKPEEKYEGDTCYDSAYLV